MKSDVVNPGIRAFSQQGVRLLMVACATLLSACSYLGAAPGMDRLVGEEGVFRDREGEYLEAEMIPRLQVPEGMDSYAIDDLLVVPEVRAENRQAFVEVPRPRPLRGNPDRSVVIQSMGDDSWVVINASASQVWPRIRQFWLNNDVPLSVERPGEGVLETGWFTMDGREGRQEKFRVTVEPGFQDDSAEVNIVHRSASQNAPVIDNISWGDRDSDDPQLEQDVLSRLSNYLAEVAGLYQTSSVSLMAGNIPSEGRAELVAEDGDEYLRLEAAYARSWAAVRRAMERGSVEIVEENSLQRNFEILYTPPVEDEPGFFARMFGAGGSRSHPLVVRFSETDGAVEVRVEAGEGLEDGALLEELETSLLTLISNTIS